MLRILMHGADEQLGLSPSLARGMPDSDCEVRALTLAKPAGTFKRRIQNLMPRFGFPKENALLLSEVDFVRPDVVWIFKGMEVYDGTLRKLSKRGLTLVNYNADHPFEYCSRGSGNSNVRRAIKHYHLHLTYSNRIRREMLGRYPGIRVSVVPFGHDVSEIVYKRIAAEEEVLRACFVGSPDQHRKRNLRVLIEAGVPVDVYGSRWDQFLKPSPLLRIHSHITGEDMLRTLRRYRLQLNFFRPHNTDSHNMRTFEVPACGGIMLAEDSAEHRVFFENGREAFFFRTPTEMIEAAQHLLKLPQWEAASVREAARGRSVCSGYTYHDRARSALDAIQAVHAARCPSNSHSTSQRPDREKTDEVVA